MKHLVWLAAFTVALLLYGCTPEYLSETELKKFLLDEGNGLRKSIKHDDYEATVIFRPSDLLVLQELKSKSVLDSSQLNLLQKKYYNQYYFILTLSKNGREAVTPSTVPTDAFSDVLQNVSFRMGEFVNATTVKQDTIPLKDFLYNRTFGMGSGSEVLLVFDKQKAINSEWVQINLGELGLGIGTQHFRFEKARLDNAPKIDFSKIDN
jgi:hypothetical protein